jgi:hypothetical protein
VSPRTRNTIRLHESGASVHQLTKPTSIQTQALAPIDSYTLTA